MADQSRIVSSSKFVKWAFSTSEYEVGVERDDRRRPDLRREVELVSVESEGIGLALDFLVHKFTNYFDHFRRKYLKSVQRFEVPPVSKNIHRIHRLRCFSNFHAQTNPPISFSNPPVYSPIQIANFYWTFLPTLMPKQSTEISTESTDLV